MRDFADWFPGFWSWRDLVLLLAGAALSLLLTLRVQRPRLVITGSGGGGSSKSHNWGLHISNLPTFFGLPFRGETAHHLNAWIGLHERDAENYPLYWVGPQRESQIAIEPGESRELKVFSWEEGSRGYCVLDHQGQPLARYEARELQFRLRISDRLGRVTRFSLKVRFNDSHLQNAPRLEIIHPMSGRERWYLIKDGLNQIRLALFGRR